jgi:FtsZ-interacting cell division protein ZipA
VSTAAIVLIAVGAVLLIGLIAWALVLSPRRREQRRLEQARSQAADHHRERAATRHTEASVAEQRAEEARLEAVRAKQDAELAREEASVHEGRADLHEQGLADDDLSRDDANGASRESAPRRS